MATRFWMVWNEGNRGPVKQHWTEQEARTEAERLAKLNPGQRFYVLVTLSFCMVQEPVHWFETDDIPF